MYGYVPTNREIRSRAWELCRGNFMKFLSASLFISMITTLVMLLGSMLGSLSVIAAIAMIIVTPALEVGLIQLSLNVWHGTFSSLSDVFSHLGSALRIWGILLWQMLYTMWFMLPAYILLVPLAAIATTGSSAISSVMGIVLMLFMILVFFLALRAGLRLSLALYVYVLNPSLPARECVRASISLSKGNLRRIFCHFFMLMLPMLAAEILLMAFSSVASIGAVAGAIVNFAVSLISILFSSYLNLGVVGLTENLLYPPQPAHERPIEVDDDPTIPPVHPQTPEDESSPCTMLIENEIDEPTAEYNIPVDDDSDNP